uniref:Uncharacterized protein n=1 Tax=Fundulus heteroclitus TaxID=8078 RepID=A0A3Q2TB83_FUNHE
SVSLAFAPMKLTGTLSLKMQPLSSGSFQTNCLCKCVQLIHYNHELYTNYTEAAKSPNGLVIVSENQTYQLKKS